MPIQRFTSTNAARGCTSSLRFSSIARALLLAGVLSSGMLQFSALAQETATAQRLSQADLAATLQRGVAVPGWVTEPDAPAPQSTDKQPVVMRLTDTQFQTGPEVASFYRRVIEVNQANSLAGVAQMELRYMPEYQKLAIHTIRILRGDQVLDKTHSANLRLLQQENNLHSGILTGSATAAVFVDDLRVGDSLEVLYTISGENPVFNGRFAASAAWDSGIPVLSRHVSVQYDVRDPVYFKIIGPGSRELNQREEKNGQRTTLHFSAKNLRAVHTEQYTPAEYDQFRWLQFSQYRSWRDVAVWANALFQAQDSGELLNKLVAEWSSLPGDEEKVQAALAYVQREIRYLSMSIGENSHRPTAPETVLKQRYGDCKDKALLLTTILNRLGVKTQPVLIATYQRRGLDRLLPSPSLFDHAIIQVRVNGKLYQLDATRAQQYGKLDKMGQAHVGSQILVVSPDTDALSKVSQERDFSSNNRKETLIVKEWKRPAELRVEQRYTGLEAEMLRYYASQQSRDELVKAYISAIQKRYPQVEYLQDFKLDDDQKENAVTIRLGFMAPDLFKKTDNGWNITYYASNFRERFWVPETPRRRYPLAVPTSPVNIDYEFKVQLPAGFNGRYKPGVTNIQSTAFQFSEKLDFVNRDISAKLHLSLSKDAVPEMQVPDFLDEVKQVGRYMENTLEIRNSDASDAIVQKADNATQQAQDQNAVKQLSLENRLKDDENNPLLLAEKALMIAQSRDTAQLAGLMAKLDAIATDDKKVMSYKAKAWFFSGQFKKSEDLLAALTKTGDDDQLWMMLALSRFQQKKWAPAQDALRNIIAQAKEPGTTKTAMILQLLCQLRMNGKLPEILFADKNKDWRSAVLDTVSGKTGDDAVLQALHADAGEAINPDVAEAYFYLGQFYAAKNNKIRSVVYLKKAREKSLPDQIIFPLLSFDKSF